MKKFDPYYIKDPTKPVSMEPQQGRSHSGRFTHKSILAVMDYENFGIDHWMWARAARGARERLDTMRSEEFRREVIDDETIFSWRMICEMYEAARDALLAGSSDEEAIAAAHAHLAAKQAELPSDYDSTAPQDVAESNRIDRVMIARWNSIPEKPL